MLLRATLVLVVLVACAPGASADETRIEVREWTQVPSCCAQRLTRGYWYRCYFRPRETVDRASLAASAGLAVTSGVILSSGDQKLIRRSSDVGPWLLPGAAIAAPVVQGDWRSAAQAALTVGLAGGVTFVGKEVINKQRPSLTSDRSYPSGHTTAAFAGAAFLYERYGPRYGIPAYVLAVHTGLARVVGNKHFLDDVIAGAGVGMLTAGLFEELFHGHCKPCTPWSWRPCWRYEFGFGAFWQDENVVRAPAAGGSAFDLARLGDWTDPRASARLTVEYFPSRYDELALRIDPAEIRTRTTAPASISFGGAVIPAGAPIDARWLGNEYRLRWRRDWLPCNRCLALRAGGTLVFADGGVEIDSPVSSPSVRSFRVAPCPHIALAYDVLPRLTVSVLGEGVPEVSFFGFDFEAAVRYRITPRWDAGVTYRWWWRPVDSSRLADDASTQALFVTVGRSF